MSKLKKVPYIGNEYYYTVVTNNFKNICLGVLGVLLYNLVNGNVNFSHNGLPGVLIIMIFTGCIYFFLKWQKDWAFGTVSKFKYKKVVAKILGFFLTIFVGVFCSYCCELMLLPKSAIGKAETCIYILKSVFFLISYMILLGLFVKFAINSVSDDSPTSKR